ncbi:MAG: glycine cleavage system aminomethyltransferase GcvT [Kosmotoga sp.]|nr:MAG: glycine cleavage system aminomethyltransferase GcvT [Kosmotoga sp.]
MAKGKRTPLYEEHLRYGAKMVDFAGWEMPIQYSSIIKEHKQVRESAGLFDVSHMGEIEIVGPDAIDFADYLVTNNVNKLKNGQICYTPMCNKKGGIIDDFLVYRLANNKVLFVVNASNTDKDFKWIKNQKDNFDVEIFNKSDKVAQLALQGPKAEKLLRAISQIELETIEFYHFTQGRVSGIETILSRTGYTGEDGFEVYIDSEAAVPLWRKILEIGNNEDILPAGLGARDTLRFEACYMLYGNDLNETITPLEAPLKWTVKFEKDFIGKKALMEQKEKGITRKLRGLRIKGKAIPRHEHKVYLNDKEVGWISSGMFAPTLKKSLALAYIDKGTAKTGSIVEVEIRKKKVEAEIVKLPFYRGSVKK